MEIKVFGPGCARCKATADLVSEALMELGMNADVRKVSDALEMMAAGVMATPALSIDGEMVSKGRVPNKEEVLTWLRERS